MTNPEPSWVREGGTVAVDSGGISFATIARLTKTQIVLEDGTKYQRGGFYKAVRSSGAFGSLTDPANPNMIQRYAQKQLRKFCAEAARITDGSTATIYELSPEDVRSEFNRLADLINDLRKEVDRRAGL